MSFDKNKKKTTFNDLSIHDVVKFKNTFKSVSELKLKTRIPDVDYDIAISQPIKCDRDDLILTIQPQDELTLYQTTKFYTGPN